MTSASNAFRVKDRRDQMVLGMTKDAARVKEKSRAARRNGLRQVEYRGTRYRRFQGRLGDALEEELRAEVRARRERSIRLMVRWLEQQELANSEEGTPREPVAESEERVGPSESEGRAGQTEGGGENSESVEPGQRLLSEFFRTRGYWEAMFNEMSPNLVPRVSRSRSAGSP